MRRDTRVQENFLAVGAAVIAAFYAIMGLVLIFYPAPFVAKSFTPNTRLILGISLVLYGIFRAYRAYTRWINAQR